MQGQEAVNEAIAAALEGLAEIRTPDPVSWFPQTLGWLAVGVLLVVGLGAFLVRSWRRWHADAYRRAALEELSVFEEEVELDGVVALAGLSELLHRSVLAVAPRERVAGLSSVQWTRLLDGSVSRPVFSECGDDLLSRLTYGRADEVDREAADRLIEASRFWIVHHDRELLIAREGA